MYYLKKGNEFVTKNVKFCVAKEQANKFKTIEEALTFFETKVGDVDNAYDYIIYDEKNPVHYINDISTYDDLDDLDMLEILFEARDIAKKLTYKINSLNESLSRHDKEVIDIYHYIEFNELGASDGYKAYKMLHNTLKARRKDKDKILEVEATRSVFSDSKINKSIGEIMSNRNEKRYSPRVMKELFSKGDSKNET